MTNVLGGAFLDTFTHIPMVRLAYIFLEQCVAHVFLEQSRRLANSALDASQEGCTCIMEIPGG